MSDHVLISIGGGEPRFVLTIMAALARYLAALGINHAVRLSGANGDPQASSELLRKFGMTAMPATLADLTESGATVVITDGMVSQVAMPSVDELERQFLDSLPISAQQRQDILDIVRTADDSDLVDEDEVRSEYVARDQRLRDYFHTHAIDAAFNLGAQVVGGVAKFYLLSDPGSQSPFSVPPDLADYDDNDADDDDADDDDDDYVGSGDPDDDD